MSPPSQDRARALIAALVSEGVRDVVLAPGSRSAPLAYAVQAAERAGLLTAHVRIDERSAAFVALGIARIRPAAVITTSGTAAANLHPAVLEAHHARVPLVVITADRPHELRGVGANQATDQVRLYGAAVRSFTELPADDSQHLGVVDAVRRAVTAATGARTRQAGPVHLNVAFRDPLTPDAAPWDRPQAPPLEVPAQAGGASVTLARGPRTVVVAGDGAPAAAKEWVQQWRWPVLAEPTSGLRGSRYAVQAGRIAVTADHLGGAVERVIVLGWPTLSRQVSHLLARIDLDVIVIAEGCTWSDVAGTARTVVDAVTVTGEPNNDTEWTNAWLRAGAAAHAAITDHPALLDGPTVAAAVLARTGPAVVLGSSMTIRDADLAAPVGVEFGTGLVLANRGLAGIDGTISTAVGVALTGRAVRALMGDLTFQHDVGGLAKGRCEPEIDLQVIVLNDDGGSIFATLEHGREEYGETFGRFFATPQGIDIAPLAAGFGAQYQRVETAADLDQVLASPINGRSVVEVSVDLTSARARAQVLNERIAAAIREG